MTAYLVAVAVGLAGAAWALVERVRLVEARRSRDAWKAQHDQLAEHNKAQADELRQLKADAADAAERAAAAETITRKDLEVCRAEVPRLIASMPPEQAARAAGDLLERSLQRARAAGAGGAAPAPGGLMPAVRPAADAHARSGEGQ